MIHDDINTIAAALEAKAAELRAIAELVEAMESAPPTDDGAELAGLRAQVAALQQQVDAGAAALASAQAQTQTIAAQLLVAQETLEAEEIDDLVMASQLHDAQEQIATLQDALDAAQQGGPITPPTGNPIRLTGAVDNERGGPMAAGTLMHWTVRTTDRRAVVATGTLVLTAEGRFSIDLVGPFEPGEPVRLLLESDDGRAPFDQTIRACAAWAPAEAQA